MDCSHASLPPTFHALETRLADLKARYQRGQIDAEAYQAEVQDLKVQDHTGQTWWLGGESGAWQYWDGSAWVRGNPASVVDAGQPVKVKRSMRPFAWGCGLGFFVIAVLAAIFLIGGWQAYQQEPKIVEDIEPQVLALTSPAPPYQEINRGLSTVKVIRRLFPSCSMKKNKWMVH
jgi:hypothetical protein